MFVQTSPPCACSAKRRHRAKDPQAGKGHQEDCMRHVQNQQDRGRLPRAQLKQKDKEKCLSCCQAIRRLQCCGCQTTKGIEHFQPSMVTLPAAGVACKECQEEVNAQVAKKFRKNWFKCRGCGEVFPATASSNEASPQHCLNCASRGTRQKDEQTCRGCKRRFHEKQEKGRKRSRRCPDCRRK